ncbi:hypothetical protein MLD38_024127 [Melastoma candidum]|uniref:Uncharacterized protein n=1 Tax=Melastoma candidum TaxID=119954 RepID=A0ACB9NSW8_9MYRT|nr:hypothetical protein MLD38_024127 [Melastoma candidum]
MAHPYASVPTGGSVVEVIIEGMVYCQNCMHYGTRSLAGAEPIAAAKVSVICRNYKNRITYYKTFETDAVGYFYGELKGFKMVHPVLDHPLQGCHVKLVSSPRGNCNVMSDVNKGIHGASLSYGDKRLSKGDGEEGVVYAAGPLAFRPRDCPLPKAHA